MLYIFRPLLFIVLLGCFGLPLYAQSTCADSLRLNQIQVVGSHNSYRKATDRGVMRVLKLVDKIVPALDILSLDYAHLPFEIQFDSFAIRGVEIDIYNDPQGGRYYNRYGNHLAWKTAKSREVKLMKPGMKVLHIPDIDYNTHYLTFKDALSTLKAWSDAHPNHIPIFVHIETKAEALGDHIKLAKFTKSIAWDATACDSIDAEIDAVFGKNSAQVITPDYVRGTYTSLNEAVTTQGWPLLSASLGKIIFIMEGGAEGMYVKGEHAGLKGRNMFVYANLGTPECAFVIRNGAILDKSDITNLVKMGYIVRTRADSGTDEARLGDYSSCKAAFSSGAQIISTDYYRPDPRHSKKSSGWTNYNVRLPKGIAARINPVFNLPCSGRGIID